MNFVQISDGSRRANVCLHATFTVLWLNIAFIAVHSGERCGPWASGLIVNVCPLSVGL